MKAELKFWRVVLVGVMAVGLVACAESGTTVAIEPVTPTPDVEKIDEANQRAVEGAEKGDSVILDEALVNYVVRVPRPGMTDAIFGVVGRESEEGERGLAVVEAADCLKNLLEDPRVNMLGEQSKSGVGFISTGVWKPDVRVDLEGTVLVAASAGVVPVITAEKVSRGEIEVDCKRGDSVVREARGAWEAIRRLIPNAPKEIGEFVGWFVRQVTDGFESGYWEGVDQ